MALTPLHTTVTPHLRSTKFTNATAALLPTSTPPPLPFSSSISSASINHPVGDWSPRCRSYSKTPPTPTIRATGGPACELQHEPSPASSRHHKTSCIMGWFIGFKNVAQRLGGKRNFERRKEKTQGKQRSSSELRWTGDDPIKCEKSSPNPEPDEHVLSQQPPQPQPQMQPQEAPQWDLEHYLQHQSWRRSDPSLVLSPEHASPPAAPQVGHQHPQSGRQSPTAPNSQLNSEDWRSDVRGYDDIAESKAHGVAHPNFASEQNLQQNDYYLSDGVRFLESYRFPFQSGCESEDLQSLNSGFDQAFSFKAPSYRGQGRVDSYATPIVEDKKYDDSIRAEIVLSPRENLRKPTSWTRDQQPRLEQPQYHGIEELSSAENEGFLFSDRQRKFSDEPVSPTAQPHDMDKNRRMKYCPPTVESVADSDLEDSDAVALQGEAEPDASEASSGAESIVSELVLNRAPRNAFRSSMSAVPRASFQRASIGSIDTVCSAEWMRGAPPSSFYPHPEEPDTPEAPNRHLASSHFHNRRRSASYSPVYNCPPDKQRVNGRANFNSCFIPSTEDVERRVAQAIEQKRQKEPLKREQEQRAREATQSEREKEIYHARITKLEYEKRKLTKENGQISRKNDELEKKCSTIATRFTEQRRKLTELEMHRREQENFQARLRNNPHGLQTPPDTASSMSTPVNPERVRAWAETLAEPALLSPEALRAQEALQEQEAMQEQGEPVRELGQAANKALHELPDLTSNKSSPVHSAQPARNSYLETLPEMSVEFIVQPQPFHSAHKHPQTRAQERRALTPVYSKRDGAVATFASQQQPLRRDEADSVREQVYRNAKPNGHQEEARHAVSRQVSRSSLKQSNEQHRQLPKQVQFEGRPKETNNAPDMTQKKPRRYRDAIKLYLKQQPKPGSTHSSPPATPLSQQSILRNKPSIQQLSNPMAIHSPNVEYYPGGKQAFQRQQLGNYENQMTPMQHQHPTQVSRQHSMPQLSQSFQNIQYAHQHAHSSPQIPTLHHPNSPHGLAAHARNQPHPETLRKSSNQTLNPSRPSTSNGHHRPMPTSSLRPSTSHGARAPSTASPLPSRPGTSHSMRGGALGSSLAPLATPPVPHLPQSFHHPPARTNNAHLPVIGNSSYVYPPPPQQQYSLVLPAPVPTFAAATTGGSSARSLDTSASHRSQLSKMQQSAYKGLAQNERANAERAADRKGGATAAQREREDAERRRLLEQQARARDLIGEGALRARIRDEVVREERKRIEEERARKEMEERVRRELEREVRERSRIEGWA